MALADFLLTALHVIVILFFLFAWAVPRLLRLHLALVVAIAFSWVVLGAWYGWGYCFLTDWAWSIKRARGETDLPLSFIEYLLMKLTDRAWNPELVYNTTAVIGASIGLISVAKNIRRKRI